MSRQHDEVNPSDGNVNKDHLMWNALVTGGCHPYLHCVVLVLKNKGKSEGHIFHCLGFIGIFRLIKMAQVTALIVKIRQREVSSLYRFSFVMLI